MYEKKSANNSVKLFEYKNPLRSPKDLLGIKKQQRIFSGSQTFVFLY
jgi:hypothetical protein